MGGKRRVSISKYGRDVGELSNYICNLYNSYKQREYKGGVQIQRKIAVLFVKVCKLICEYYCVPYNEETIPSGIYSILYNNEIVENEEVYGITEELDGWYLKSTYNLTLAEGVYVLKPFFFGVGEKFNIGGLKLWYYI